MTRKSLEAEIARKDAAAPVRLRLEVADGLVSRARGMMWRDGFEPGVDGMLFCYAKPRPVQFWMAGVRIPLDMVFIDRYGRLRRIAARVPAGSWRSQGSGGPVRWVIEMPGGMAERMHLRVGDKFWLRHPPS